MIMFCLYPTRQECIFQFHKSLALTHWVQNSSCAEEGWCDQSSVDIDCVLSAFRKDCFKYSLSDC